MKFKAAVFDLDGTLLDTLEDLADSVNALLARHGWPQHPLDAYRYFVGDGPVTLLERALPDTVDRDGGMDALVAEYKEEYGRRWDAKSRPYPGIPELLEGLKSCGLQLAVLSNKPHEFTELCVRKLLPGNWEWSAVLGLRDGSPKKPDPNGALEIAMKLGVAPADCVYFGDTATDMQTALAAGMYPVGVLWGFREEAELREAGARQLIARPEEFLSGTEGNAPCPPACSA